MLARLRELPVLVLNLVEQPHVLDRDHSLVGKGLQQRDLPLGEQAGHGARDRDHADGITVTQQRYRHDAAIGHDPGELRARIGGHLAYVRNLGDSTAQDRTAADRVLAHRPREHPVKNFQPFGAASWR